jgi:multiple sugar transport system substrate-binding protein
MSIRKRKKGLVLLGLGLSMALLISVCSGKEEKVKISYWHFDGNPTSTPIYQELVKRFMAKNPQIEVEYVGFPSSSYYQKYNIAIATNSMPDAAGIKEMESSGLLSQGVFEPLDKRFKTWKERGNIDKEILKTERSETPDGKLYILPFFMTAKTVWYNKTLLAQNGIKPPQTIDQFMKLCEKHADPKNGKYFFSMRGGNNSVSNLFDFIFSYAGVTKFFDAVGNCRINTPKCVKGLEAYASIYWNGWVSKNSITNDFKEMVGEFGSGSSMYIDHDSSSEPQHIKNLGAENVMNALYPAGPAGITSIKAPTYCGPSILKTSKHKDAAWKFISYLASAEAESYLCEKEGRLPVNSGVYKYEWYQKDPFLKYYNNTAKNRKVKFWVEPVWLPQWHEFCSKVQGPDFQAVLLKKKSAKEVLDRWSELLTQYQKEYLEAKKKK